MTDMREKYLLSKQYRSDAILFFRIGDSFETFYDDAVTVAHELDFPIEKINDGEEIISKCSVPAKNEEYFIKRLDRRGYKVVICNERKY